MTYCTKFGIACDLANVFGVCTVTACTRRIFDGTRFILAPQNVDLIRPLRDEEIGELLINDLDDRR